MSPLWSKKASVAATDERNIIILHRKIVNIEPIYEVYCSVWSHYICHLSILFWGCLDGIMVKDVRRCSARRARRIRGFNSHRSRNIYMDYASTVVEKDKRRCYRWENTDKRNIIILHNLETSTFEELGSEFINFACNCVIITLRLIVYLTGFSIWI